MLYYISAIFPGEFLSSSQYGILPGPGKDILFLFVGLGLQGVPYEYDRKVAGHSDHAYPGSPRTARRNW